MGIFIHSTAIECLPQITKVKIAGRHAKGRSGSSTPRASSHYVCVCVSLYVGMRKCLCLGKPEGNSRMPGAEVAGRVNHMIGLGTVLWSFVRTASTTH